MTGSGVRRLTGGAGLTTIALVGLALVAFPGSPPGPAAPAEQVVRWTLDDRRGLLVGSVLIAMALGGAIVFFAGLRSLCGARAEGAPGIFATIGWGAILVGCAVVFAGLAMAQTQSSLVLDGDPATVEAFHDARLLLFDIAGMPAAVSLCAFGVAMVRTGFPARWLGAFAGLAAVAQLAGVVALSRTGFLSPAGGGPLLASAALVLWIAAVSIVLLVGGRAPR